jgi:ribosomal protein S7
MKPYFFFDLYLKFISFIFKAGKKFFWENSLSFIFSNLSLYLHYSKSLILAKIFMRLFTRVELKKIKSRNRTSFIPFFIKINRSIFLALKWIFSSVVKNTAKISFKNKLYIELLQILTLKSCSSLKKLEDNNTLAYFNRSNTHFRWS